MAVNTFIGKIIQGVSRGLSAYRNMDFGPIATEGILSSGLNSVISSREYITEDSTLFVMGVDKWGSKAQKVAK